MMNALSMAGLIVAVSVFAAIAAVAPASIFKGMTYSKPPDGPGTDTKILVKIATELERPCDKKEFVLWNSNKPAVDVTVLSAATTVGLSKTYEVTDKTVDSAIAQKDKVKVLGADATNGSGQLTLAWMMSTTSVTLAACGDSATLLSAEPPTKSERDDMQTKAPPPPTKVTAKTKPKLVPGEPGNPVLLSKELKEQQLRIKELEKEIGVLRKRMDSLSETK